MRIQHLIDGKAVESCDYFETVNPATQEVLAEVASAGEVEVNVRWPNCIGTGGICGRFNSLEPVSTFRVRGQNGRSFKIWVERRGIRRRPLGDPQLVASISPAGSAPSFRRTTPSMW